MKFPTLNIILSVILFTGLFSCGQQSKSHDDHEGHEHHATHEEGHDHDHDHGHSHKAENMTLSDGAYKVDIEKSYIKWTGKKFTGDSHFGKLKLSEGTVDITQQVISSKSKFTVDMNSITVEDIPADHPKNGKLKGHLLNDDFFGVEKYPTVSFIVTKVKKGEKQGIVNVTGDLTIKGITHPISFPAHIMNHDGSIHAMADIVFNRAHYDIKYKSNSFFSDLGDKAIKDDIELELHLYASK